MPADANAVAADRCLAPDPRAARGPIDEQPGAERIAAMLQPIPFRRERQQRRQQVVGHAVPPRRDRVQRAVGPQPVVDTREGLVQPRAPRVQVERRLVDERPGKRAQLAQPGQLAVGWRWIRDRDVMGPKELDRVHRCIEVIVGRIVGPCPPSVMGARPVLAVGQPEDRVRTEA
jgi:hypothetical protein